MLLSLPLFKLIIYEQENPTADIWISATTFPEMAKSRGMIQMGGRIAVISRPGNSVISYWIKYTLLSHTYSTQICFKNSGFQTNYFKLFWILKVAWSKFLQFTCFKIYIFVTYVNFVLKYSITLKGQWHQFEKIYCNKDSWCIYVTDHKNVQILGRPLFIRFDVEIKCLFKSYL